MRGKGSRAPVSHDAVATAAAVELHHPKRLKHQRQGSRGRASRGADRDLSPENFARGRVKKRGEKACVAASGNAWLDAVVRLEGVRQDATDLGDFVVCQEGRNYDDLLRKRYKQ